MSKEDEKGHGLTPEEVEKAKGLYPTLKSQQRVAKSLGVAKWKINLLFRKEKVSKPQPKGLAEYNQDLNYQMNVLGETKITATLSLKRARKWRERKAKREHKKWKSEKDRLTSMRGLKKKFEKLIKKGEATWEDYLEARGAEVEEYVYGETPQ